MIKSRASNHAINGMDYRKKLIENQLLCESALGELKKIYWHEKELLIAIPLLLRSAQTFELVDSLTLLSNYTEEHIKQLEKDFPGIAEVVPKIRTYTMITAKNSI